MTNNIYIFFKIIILIYHAQWSPLTGNVSPPPVGFERLHLPLCLVGETAFRLQNDDIPGNTIGLHRPNAVSMLGHRLRRWPSIETALGHRLVFAEIWINIFRN